MRQHATGSATPHRVRQLTALAALGLATAVAGFALDHAGLPSSYLFAALLVGLAAALALPRVTAVPAVLFRASQAVVGVSLGAQVRSSSLSALAHSWLPVTLVSVGTLLISLAAGKVLARVTFVDEPTGALGMVAGGASGIVTMADELGADDRLVAFMQYVRVLVVVVLTPLLIAIFGGGQSAPTARGPGAFAHPRDWLFVALIAPLGALGARALRIPAGTLLGPMLVSGALTLAGVGFAVPPAIRELSFALIGLQVGLRFTLDTVRQLGRLLIPVLGAV